MRVLLINTSERIGGAAIAASRLLRALNRHGVEAEMLVRDKQTDNPRVAALGRGPVQQLRFVAERADIFVRNGLTRHNLFAIDAGRFGTDITRRPEFERANVIHLHWVNQGLLSLADVQRICQSGKRVVWTMHDMWPFTGICHYADTCEGWLTGCGNCRLLKRPSEHDLSYKTFEKKRRLLALHQIGFVGCSNWLTDLARRSPLLQNQKVVSIPNALDTSRYTPAADGGRPAVRRRLGLPETKRLLLFVAYKVTDEKKGFAYLREAVERLCRDNPAWREQLAVVAVGREASTIAGTMPTEVVPVEYVSDPQTMIDYYRAADLLVMPTLMDNLPNTIAESMACGTPCVGFEVGGLPQMIRHGETGYLARYKDADDFAHCLAHALTLPTADYEALCRAARRAAVRDYSEESVADKYIKLYERRE